MDTGRKFTSMNVENQDKQVSGTELISYTEIVNSPFVIVTQEGVGNWVVLGNYRVSEVFADVLDALEDAKRMDWERLVHVMSIISEVTLKFKELK